MTFEDFLTLCESPLAPSTLSPYLRALYFDRRGEWDEAHEEIQDGTDAGSAAIHAYLHRKEGDISNARYWYSSAGRSPFRGSLVEEWEFLVKEFLSQR